MPTQLQLEGPDLESLLTRVKTEVGPEARIVRAEKVRTGGIGGFFARQRFEVTVEVDPQVDAQADAQADAHVDAQPLSVLDLAERVSDVEKAGAPAGPVGDRAVVPAAPQDVLAGPARGADQVSRPADVPEPPARAVPVAAEVSTEGRTFADVLANLEAATGATTDTWVDVPARPLSSGTSATPPGSPGHALAARRREEPAAEQLSRLGLPAHLQPAVRDDLDVCSALVSALRALPTAAEPPGRAGAVLAVVGPMSQALDTARALARDLDLPALSSVLLATSRPTSTDMPDVQVVRDLDDAQTRRDGWRRRPNATIVAIDAPMTAEGAVRARAFLSVLQPALTWGAVEATRKTDDVAAFARAVGGFDALALTDVEETADPGAVLELGIPVARLDGKPATAAAWAALLAGRLAA